MSPGGNPSSTGHVKPGVNLEGPSSKAKYVQATDSEEVRRLKNEKNPVEGSEIEPETIHLQAVGALWLLNTEEGPKGLETVGKTMRERNVL